MKLILWDIDGTLVSNVQTPGHVALDEYHRAVFEVTGIKKPGRPQKIDGSTDMAIILDILEKSDIKKEEAERIFPRVLRELEKITTPRDFIQKTRSMIVGASETLFSLSKDTVQTYATGNSPKRARAKTEAFGLDLFLDEEIGGFGSWTSEREAFIEKAIDLSEKKHGLAERVIVIGDTPSDINAAREVGVEAVLVAGGVFSLEDLRKLNPDLLVGDLSERKLVDFILR